MRVEVFKTNVNDRGQADWLVRQIEKAFENCAANFDLEDCDRVLRVQTSDPRLDVCTLIAMLRDLGFQAQVLPDDIPSLLQF